MVREGGETEGFDSKVLNYTATTTNDTDKITATATDPEAVILIEVNEEELENEGSAEWVEGDNAVVITVTNGEEQTVYTVAVTKTDD